MEKTPGVFKVAHLLVPNGCFHSQAKQLREQLAGLVKKAGERHDTCVLCNKHISGNSALKSQWIFADLFFA